MPRRACLVLPLLLVACSGNPENNAACGFAAVAAGSMVLQSLDNLALVVSQAPENLPRVLPAKVVGHGTTRAETGTGAPGLILRYGGEGFPKVPGFGLLLVDDSTEAVRGLLIYEPEEPKGYPRLGVVSNGQDTIPLFGVRIHWASLNAPRCPMFQPLDSTTQQ